MIAGRHGNGLSRRSTSGWHFLQILVWAAASLIPAHAVQAQFQNSTRYELSEAVYIDEVDNAARTHLTQLDQYIQAQQWDEVLSTLGLLMETNANQLIDTGNRCYISVRDFCHQRYSALPPEILAQYRTGVDAQAKGWLDEGKLQRDPKPLQKIVQHCFASSWGDDALDCLAEIALEQGRYSIARTSWEMMLPLERRVNYAGPGSLGGTLLAYPDTGFQPAEVNARLVLTSILEGNTKRAQRELGIFQLRYPEASGKLAGREGKYIDLLQGLFAGRSAWPERTDDDQWQTFAGSNERTKIAPYALDIGAKQWEIPLEEVGFNELVAFAPGPSIRRVATSHPLTRAQQWLLSHHPVVADGMVFFNTSQEISAYELSTGKPAWNQKSAVIFEDTTTAPVGRNGFHAISFGIPRYSMTVENHRLYARMGSPLTSTLSEAVGNERRGYLVCLDLKAQGRLLWKFYPQSEKLAFEGSPLSDGRFVYIALRHSDVRPQTHVACFDADTGQQRWIRQICSAETIGRGQYEETTSNLLTLHDGYLYLNTNLGAIAKIAAADGHIEWIHVYRQRQTGDLNQPYAYLRRDLTPCIYCDGRIFAAPSDSERIYAFDADTGELLWDSRYAPDAIHLLGVGAGYLLASGDRLYWIDCETGKLAHYWPDGPSPKGFGRGVLAGSRVFWPTRNAILIFDQRSGRLERTKDLRGDDQLATAGNLLIADHLLLVAAANKLSAMGEFSRFGNDDHADRPAAQRPPAKPKSSRIP